jgi:hypothetical protein
LRKSPNKIRIDSGLIDQKNGLSRDIPGGLGIIGLQPKYRFQIHQ